ncbi:MAG: PSD1 and planctomycete cytochrome C domain-containing protein [Isosphaeraceae bacterium]
MRRRSHDSGRWPFLMGVVLGSAIFGTTVKAFADDSGAKVDYDRDVRPILSNTCFACHGPDPKPRKAELRLDRKDDVLRDRDGYAVVVPGDVEASELAARIEADDDTILMPPPKSGKSLTKPQIDILKRWIAQGAEWRVHWSFLPLERPPVPEVHDPAWPRTPIDRFLLARMEREGLSPSAEADKPTLIRRVTLDLTGLPPTPTEVDAFLADQSTNAYETLVDRLIRSPRFGEHMARYWLDAARYGDTHGLHLDNYREIWPYRDWVIRAFNDNMPFDQFLTEQLAGDLLPNPTVAQLVATGFNRCNVSTSEGGSIEEEVYVRNVIDRVDTTSTVFLGLTVGCARCHDHKFDPITQKDFYQFFAFFNNLDGPALDGNGPRPAPSVPVPSPEQQAAIADIQTKIALTRASITKESSKIKYDDSIDLKLGEYVARADYVWLDDAVPEGAKPSEAGGTSLPLTFVEGPDHPVYSGSKSVPGSAQELAQSLFTDAKRALKVGQGDILFAYVFIDPTKPPKELMLQWHTDGWKHRAYWGQNVIDWGKDGTTERLRIGPLPKTGQWVRLEVEVAKLGLKPGATISGWAFTQQGGSVYWDHAGIETWTPQDGQEYANLSTWVAAQRALGGSALPKELQGIVTLDRSKRTDAQKTQLRDYFLVNAYAGAAPALAPLRASLAKLEAEQTALEAQVPTTLIFTERAEPKPAFLLNRGEYDQKRDQVSRALPAFLPPMPEGASTDRLGLARWLVAPEHPLTARVEVNRLWQQCFGTGLVKTSEDFGAQGDRPSHPELLDWLATQFQADGWDLKTTLKRMVMSAAYRQSSTLTPDRLAKDPENRLLSRGPRYRLDAESLRDQALFVSGLLVERVGGPSFKPPQPAGLWEAVGYTSSNTAKFVADTDPDKVHRRSLYIFWKRTSPPPQMTTFDAPSREACFVRRERTNTPLQALILMNETQYVEAARALAGRIMRDGGSTIEDRLTYAYRLVAARPPRPDELAELTTAYQSFLETYTKDPEAAKGLLSIGATKADDRLAPNELAAWTLIGNLLLNLDEVINKG